MPFHKVKLHNLQNVDIANEWLHLSNSRGFPSAISMAVIPKDQRSLWKMHSHQLCITQQQNIGNNLCASTYMHVVCMHDNMSTSTSPQWHDITLYNSVHV